jgi:hypothetical protein
MHPVRIHLQSMTGGVLARSPATVATTWHTSLRSTAVARLAGAGLLPRARGWSGWVRGLLLDLKVAAPRPNGRRSGSGEHQQRRRSRLTAGASYGACWDQFRSSGEADAHRDAQGWIDGGDCRRWRRHCSIFCEIPSEGNEQPPASENLLTRFLLQGERVEGGDDGGDHAVAWEGSSHRRKEMAGVARVSVWEKLEQRRREIGS